MPFNEWFEGTIGRTVADSTPHHRSRPHPGEGAPNVLVILYDDLGFGHFGCYGSTLNTPNADALAAGGLRYSNFHVTPLCSPTRASLLTGRNHHSVGMRAVANFNTGFPHMLGHISDHAATVAEVLRDEGYATFCTGKWHLCQMEDASAAGPFAQWPCQRGFDRFYGFLQGETDQFAPELTYDNHFIDPPSTAEDGYHLSEDLVDQMIGFVRDSKSILPDKPFFGYLSFGATHAPHQAPEEYLDKYRGAFDEGWDTFRERWFERQLDLGIIPADTTLAPRNPGVDAWDDLTDDGRAVSARLQEAFAAFLDHTDVQIGRVVEFLREIDEFDNTIVVLTADNGASQEGGPFGVLHEMKFFNGLFDSAEDMAPRIDDIGGRHSHTNYPWGWAQAGNTPNRWYKQNTHGGGVRTPFIVHWPQGISDAGAIRHQFHHVSDVAPTVYDLLGIEAPAEYGGLEQLPVTGTSMAYTFEAAEVPSRKTTQYFEMVGHRGIYHEGWKAVTRHEKGGDFDTETWELYDLTTDFSECNDLAAEQPEKLKELIDLWWSEAEEHGVLPLDDRLIELFGTSGEPNTPHASRTYTYYPPISHLPAEASPAIGGRSWIITATIDREAGQQGALYATGTENSGVSFFVKDDRVHFDYNFFGDHRLVVSDIDVPVGSSTVAVHFTRQGREGSAELFIDGDPCGAGPTGPVMRMMSSVGADVGIDRLSPVSDQYTGEFAFEGRLHRLDVEVLPTPRELAQAEAEAAAEMARQ